MQAKTKDHEREAYSAKAAYQDDRVATQYDQARFGNLRGKLGDWLDKRAIRRALDSSTSSHTFLDIPCGTGRITSFLLEEGYEVCAADVSVEMMSVARSRFSRHTSAPLSYIQVDAMQLPFRSASFDCASAIRFMGHVPPATRIKVLRELARVSRGPVMADYCIYHPVTHLRRWIENLVRARRFGFAQSWAWQSIPKRQLKSEFQAAGLEAARWVPKMRLLSDAWIVLLERYRKEQSE